MGDTLHISAITVMMISGLLGLMLAIIAFFLSRLISQFDKLAVQFSQLNNTMLKIDKDISGDVRVLSNDNDSLKKGVDEVWKVVHIIDNKVSEINSNGCIYAKNK